MHKILVTYTQPDDVEAFDKYFRDVHAPMVRQIPGLKKLVVNRITGNAMGGEPSCTCWWDCSSARKRTSKRQ